MAREARPRFHKSKRQWYARTGEVGPDGRARQEYFPATIRTESEAWEYFRRVREARAAGSINLSDPTVRGLAAMYEVWLATEVREDRVSRETVRARISGLRLFAFFRPTPSREIGQLQARSLRIDDMEAFVRWMIREKYKGHYVKDVVRAVQAMLNWAARPIADREPRKLLESNPVAGLKLDVTAGGTVGYVDTREARAFLRWMWGRAREPRKDPKTEKWKAGAFPLHLRFNRLFVLMLHFVRLTGCRPKEAARALWSDVDWETGVVTLDSKRHKTGRKTGKERTIFFSGRAAKILRAIQALEGRHPEFIFTHRLGRGGSDRGAASIAGEPWSGGGPIAQKVRLLRTEAVRAGLASADGFTAYLMRHGWITDALLEGGSTTDVAKMAGNSAAVIERVYDHAVKDRLAERAKALAEARRRSGKR